MRKKTNNGSVNNKCFVSFSYDERYVLVATNVHIATNLIIITQYLLD